MFRLVYVSAASVPFAREDLIRLLESSRSKNERANVTGMLLYRDGDFMQLLEGDEARVKTLYQRIQRDPRHAGTILMLEEHSEERLFSDWSMGFRDLDDPDVQALPGFSPFLNTPLHDERFTKDASEALVLLSMFKPSL